MKGLSITRVTLDPAVAAEILTTAIEAGNIHGIGYWAHARHATRKADVIIRLQIEDVEGAPEGEEPKRYLLDVKAVQKAVGKMLKDPEGCECAGSAARLIEQDHVDGPLADVIVQVACFGKVIYG